MAQDTVDAAIKSGLLGDVPESLTRNTPLLGAAGWAALRNRAGALAGEHGRRGRADLARAKPVLIMGFRPF